MLAFFLLQYYNAQNCDIPMSCDPVKFSMVSNMMCVPCWSQFTAPEIVSAFSGRGFKRLLSWLSAKLLLERENQSKPECAIQFAIQKTEILQISVSVIELPIFFPSPYDISSRTPTHPQKKHCPIFLVHLDMPTKTSCKFLWLSFSSWSSFGTSWLHCSVAVHAWEVTANMIESSTASRNKNRWNATNKPGMAIVERDMESFFKVDKSISIRPLPYLLHWKTWQGRSGCRNQSDVHIRAPSMMVNKLQMAHKSSHQISTLNSSHNPTHSSWFILNPPMLNSNLYHSPTSPLQPCYFFPQPPPKTITRSEQKRQVSTSTSSSTKWSNKLKPHCHWIPLAKACKAQLPILLFTASIPWACWGVERHCLWGWNCWWLRSCTTRTVWNPVNNGINYLSTGAGFQPSTEGVGQWMEKQVAIYQK